MSSRLPGSRTEGFALQPDHARWAVANKKKKRRTDLGGERSPRSARSGLSRVRARAESSVSRYFFRGGPTPFSRVKNILRMRCILGMAPRDIQTVHDEMATSKVSSPPVAYASIALARQLHAYGAMRLVHISVCTRSRGAMREHTRSYANGLDRTGRGLIPWRGDRPLRRTDRRTATAARRARRDHCGAAGVA